MSNTDTPPTNHLDHPRHSTGSSSSSEGDDIFLTIDTRDASDDTFAAIEQPRPLGRIESLKERQISVDPISLRGPMVRQASFTLVSPGHPSSAAGKNLTITLPKLKFVTSSLPTSASSSPRSIPTSHLTKTPTDTNQTVARSRSMSDREFGDEFDFDLMIAKPENQESTTLSSILSMYGKSGKAESRKSKAEEEEGFTCGKLCLFLPRGKGKPVKAASASSSAVSPLPLPLPLPAQSISRTVSMERFDCGKVSNAEATSLFFDLPLEMIRCSVSDMQSPVTASFVFDKEEKPKGVLKKVTVGGERKSKSNESIRQVRFSTSSPITYPSSPTCVTPRLKKARDEFSAFLDAQSA